MSGVTSEIRQRIIDAAEKLHAADPAKPPKVDDVRKLAKVAMGDASSVMKEWRQQKLMPVKRIEEEAPSEIQIEARTLVSQIWTTAKDQSEAKLREAEARYTEERAEAEQLRSELSDACDSLQQQLDSTAEALKVETITREQEETINQALQAKVEALEKQLAKAQEAERVATAKNIELDKHISTQTNDISRLEKELTEKDEKITSLTNALEGIKLKLHESEKEAFRLIDKYNSEVVGLEKRIIEMQGQINTAESTTKQAREHIQDLKGLLEQQQSQKDSLQQQLDKTLKALEKTTDTKGRTPTPKPQKQAGQKEG